MIFRSVGAGLAENTDEIIRKIGKKRFNTHAWASIRKFNKYIKINKIEKGEQN